MKRVKFKTGVGRFESGRTYEVGNKSAGYFARRGVAEFVDEPHNQPRMKSKSPGLTARENALDIKEDKS